MSLGIQRHTSCTRDMVRVYHTLKSIRQVHIYFFEWIRATATEQGLSEYIAVNKSESKASLEGVDLDES
jgi:hypothetical protein